MSDRYPHCPTCTANNVSDLHVDRCAEIDRYEKAAIQAGDAADIPNVTTADLWAHFNSSSNAVQATRLVRLAIDLGWRPVVGSNPKRLWSAATHPPHDPAAPAANEED